VSVVLQVLLPRRVFVRTSSQGEADVYSSGRSQNQSLLSSLLVSVPPAGVGAAPGVGADAGAGFAHSPSSWASGWA